MEDTIEKLEKQKVTVESLINIYISKYFENQESSESKELIKLISGYLKKNPEECYKIIDIIRNNLLPVRGSGFLFLILEKTGHSKAQEALISIMESSEAFTKLSKVRAVVALMGIPNITMDNFKRLITVDHANLIKESDAKGTVLLAIGAFGRNSINPDIKDKAVDYIKKKNN